MSKNHEKGHEHKPEAKHDRKHVKSHLDIALERASAMEQGGAAAKPPSPAEARVSETELAALRERSAKADEYYDRLLRTAAEFENYKKRAERERADLLKYGQEEIMGELLGVIDNFERALSSAAVTADAKGLVEGVSLIRKQLLAVLEKFGLRPIEAVGKPFNPELHEAVSQVETGEQPEGTVVGEQLRGYTLNGRLLRPAVVTVAVPPAGDGEPPPAP